MKFVALHVLKQVFESLVQSQVTFISIAFYTIQIVLKQIYIDSECNKLCAVSFTWIEKAPDTSSAIFSLDNFYF